MAPDYGYSTSIGPLGLKGKVRVQLTGWHTITWRAQDNQQQQYALQRGGNPLSGEDECLPANFVGSGTIPLPLGSPANATAPATATTGYAADGSGLLAQLTSQYPTYTLSVFAYVGDVIHFGTAVGADPTSVSVGFWGRHLPVVSVGSAGA